MLELVTLRYLKNSSNCSDDEWGRCDASCGEGMKKSKRFCDNPSPAGGGAECKGKEIKETSCLAIDEDGKNIPCPRKYLSIKVI